MPDTICSDLFSRSALQNCNFRCIISKHIMSYHMAVNFLLRPRICNKCFVSYYYPISTFTYTLINIMYFMVLFQLSPYIYIEAYYVENFTK